MKIGLIGCGFFAQNQVHPWRDFDGIDVVKPAYLTAAEHRTVKTEEI